MVEKNDRKSSSPKCKVGDGQPPGLRDREFALKYYEVMLGALGSRERQVIQMFAYVAPAMAAMAWIVTTATDNALLLLGGPYILAIILAEMGGGRQKMDDEINHAVGLNVHVKVGHKIEKNDVIAEICHPQPERFEQKIAGAITISTDKPVVRPMIIDRIYS